MATILALRNGKAKKWVNAQKDWAVPLQQLNSSKTTVWMHCASLGEFEQGRPVLERLRKDHSQIQIVLSFFSPSGYDACSNTNLANVVCYLPLDSASNARTFIANVKPNLVIWVKYEFWHFYLDAIKKEGIPAILVSAKFRAKQVFFKGYGKFWRNMLHCFTHIFVQDSGSQQLLQQIGINISTVGGDTRFDRVAEIANGFTALPTIEKFCGENRVVVAGSTWLDDDEELCHFVKANPLIRFIIAPHEVDEESIKEVMEIYPNATLYSKYAEDFVSNGNVLIINNIGMLSRLYYYADIAFIGGGFGSDGVHNVLEAAVFGKPLVYGPEIEKYKEAIDLVECGAAFTVDDALDLEQLLNSLFSDNAELDKAANAAINYVNENGGATQKVTQFIYENRLLMS